MTEEMKQAVTDSAVVVAWQSDRNSEFVAENLPVNRFSLQILLT